MKTYKIGFWKTCWYLLIGIGLMLGAYFKGMYILSSTLFKVSLYKWVGLSEKEIEEKLSPQK